MTDVTGERAVLEWHWQKKVQVRAYLAMWRHHKRRAGQLALGVAVGVATAVLIGLAVGIRGISLLGFAVVVALGSLLGGRVGEQVRARLRARRIERKCAGEHGDITVTADPEGVQAFDIDSRIELKWSAFERVHETTDFMLLYTSSGGGLCVPKAPVDAGELDRFRAMAALHVPGASQEPHTT